MANNSKIEWTDHTINFWTGCIKVSDGCKFCYMYRGKERWHKDPTVVIQTNESTVLNQLNQVKSGEKVFTCSWSDFFIEEADVWRDWAWSVIRTRPDVHWQILTKRPERISKCLPEDWGEGYPNVWLGITIENQKAANIRIPVFDKIKAAVKFISFEPLIGPVDLFEADLRYHAWDLICNEIGPGEIYKEPNMEWDIDWAILGSESGNDTGKYRYRPSEVSWYEELIMQLQENETPLFVKQLGTHLAKQYGLKDRHGTNMEEWPESLNHLKIREFPQ